MKVKTCKSKAQKKFKPLTLKVTFETPAELLGMLAITGEITLSQVFDLLEEMMDNDDLIHIVKGAEELIGTMGMYGALYRNAVIQGLIT